MLARSGRAIAGVEAKVTVDSAIGASWAPIEVRLIVVA